MKMIVQEERSLLVTTFLHESWKKLYFGNFEGAHFKYDNSSN